jgi:hypothetical protein
MDVRPATLLDLAAAVMAHRSQSLRLSRNPTFFTALPRGAEAGSDSCFVASE